MQETAHSRLSKSVAALLIIPIIVVTSFSFPRPAQALFLVPILINTILLAATTVVVIDAVSCYIDIFWGCTSTNPNGTTTTVNIPRSASLVANPSTIDSGQSSNLTWTSTGTTRCDSAGGFSTGGATNGGPVSTGPLTSTQNYQITCIGIGGNAQANATVTVRVPNVVIVASPDRVVSGGTATISWNVSNVNSCVIKRNGVDWQNVTTAGPTRSANGSAADTITGQTTYTISCTNNASGGGGAFAASATKIVNIISSFQEF